MFTTLTAIFKGGPTSPVPPGGFCHQPGTPNFLLNLDDVVTQVQYTRTSIGDLIDGTFTLRNQFESVVDKQAGNWIVFGAMGGFLSADTAAGAGTLQVDYALRELWGGGPCTGKNLCPGSEIFQGWTLTGNFNIAPAVGGPPVGTNYQPAAIAITTAGTSTAFSPPFSVTPGTTYAVSALLDTRAVTSGAVALKIYSTDHATLYQTFTPANGTVGRQNLGTWTPGGGVTAACFEYLDNGISLFGGPVLFSQPQIEVGISYTPYELNVWDESEFQPGDSILIGDGINYEIFKVAKTAFSGTTVTITLGPAQSENSSVLLNSFFAGTKVTRLVYQGIIMGRQRTTNLADTFSLKTQGMWWRYSKMVGNFGMHDQDSAVALYNLAAMYATQVPEVIVLSGNFAPANSILFNCAFTLDTLANIITDVLRAESGEQVPSAPSESSFWAMWVNELREVHHQQVATQNVAAPTYTLDLVSGSIHGDILGPLEPIDMDLSRMLNAVVATGGLDINGNLIDTVLTVTPSIAIWGLYEGYLTNTQIAGGLPGEMQRALLFWAAGQIGVLAWPQMTGRLQILDASLRLSPRDLVLVSGFTDGSTLILNPTTIRYSITMSEAKATADISLTALQPNFQSVMAEIANQHSIRNLELGGSATTLTGGPTLLSGCLLTTSGLVWSTTAGAVFYAGQTYYVPPATGTMTNGTRLRIGIQVAGSTGSFVGPTGTWNPSDVDSGITLSGGNLTATRNASASPPSWQGVRSTVGLSSGQSDWEIAVAGSGGVISTYLIRGRSDAASNPFVIPGVGATFNITVGLTSWVNGDYIDIFDGVHDLAGQITAGGGTTSLTVTCLGSASITQTMGAGADVELINDAKTVGSTDTIYVADGSAITNGMSVKMQYTIGSTVYWETIAVTSGGGTNVLTGTVTGNSGLSSGYGSPIRFPAGTNVTATAGGQMAVGVVDVSSPRSRFFDSATGYGYYGAIGAKINNGVLTTYGAPYAAGDKIDVLLDMVAGTISFTKNGVNQGIAFSGLTGTLFPVVSLYTQGDAVTANFGPIGSYTFPPSTIKLPAVVTMPIPQGIAGGSSLSAADWYSLDPPPSGSGPLVLTKQTDFIGIPLARMVANNGIISVSQVGTPTGGISNLNVSASKKAKTSNGVFHFIFQSGISDMLWWIDGPGFILEESGPIIETETGQGLLVEGPIGGITIYLPAIAGTPTNPITAPPSASSAAPWQWGMSGALGWPPAPSGVTLGQPVYAMIFFDPILAATDPVFGSIHTSGWVPIFQQTAFTQAELQAANDDNRILMFGGPGTAPIGILGTASSGTLNSVGPDFEQ